MATSETLVGSLRHRVALQSQTRVADGYGGFVVTWNTYATVWGKLTPRAGAESMQAGRIEAKTTHDLRIRYRSDVTTAHRALYNNRPLQIRSVLNVDERQRWLDLELEEGVAT